MVTCTTLAVPINEWSDYSAHEAVNDQSAKDCPACMRQ